MVLKRSRMARSMMAAVVAALLPGAHLAQAQTAAPARKPGITVELNKLETVPNACRGFFLIANATTEPLRELKLDVFFFDKGGVILNRVGLNFADIRAERSRVVIFDVPNTSCNDVGRLLINDVLACTKADGAPLLNCAQQINVATRAAVELAY